MSRQRITQRPANTFGKTADLYLMNNEDRKQPSATDYMNGDPSAWAEDVRPAPKPGTERDPVNGLPLLQESNYTHRNSEEWGDDGKPYDNMNPRIATENARLAMRQVHAELSRNASLALRVAEIMLRNAPTSIVEAQALDLMSLSHSQIQATLERLAGQEMDEDEDHDKDAGQEVEEEEVEEASKKKASKKATAKKSKKASEDEDEDHDKDAAKKHAEDHEDEDEDESKEASEDEDEDESKEASEDEDEDHTEEANKKASVSPEKLRQFMATFQQLKEENARLASQVKASSAKAAKAAKAAKVASVEEEIERDLDALLKEHEASEDALDMGMLGEEASMDDSLDAMMDGDDMMDGILFEDDISDDMEDPFFMSEASTKTAGRKPVQSLNQVTKTAGKLDDEIRDLQKLWASDPQID